MCRFWCRVVRGFLWESTLVVDCRNKKRKEYCQIIPKVNKALLFFFFFFLFLFSCTALSRIWTLPSQFHFLTINSFWCGCEKFISHSLYIKLLGHTDLISVNFTDRNFFVEIANCFFLFCKFFFLFTCCITNGFYLHLSIIEDMTEFFFVCFFVFIMFFQLEQITAILWIMQLIHCRILSVQIKTTQLKVIVYNETYFKIMKSMVLKSTEEKFWNKLTTVFKVLLGNYRLYF